MTVEIDQNKEHRERRLTAWRLVNSYKFHSNETGFMEWKQETPQYVKDYEQRLFETAEDWSKF